MLTVTGSPVIAVVDALRVILRADTDTGHPESLATLLGSAARVYDHVPGAARLAYPYLVLGRRSRTNEAGALQAVGSVVSVQVDGWSDAKGPYQMQRIVSRVAALLERRPTLSLGPYVYLERSLTCEHEEVFDEADLDAPEQRLYHGVQRWALECHEA